MLASEWLPYAKKANSQCRALRLKSKNCVGAVRAYCIRPRLVAICEKGQFSVQGFAVEIKKLCWRDKNRFDPVLQRRKILRLYAWVASLNSDLAWLRLY
jgi:hypothetical protein